METRASEGTDMAGVLRSDWFKVDGGNQLKSGALCDHLFIFCFFFILFLKMVKENRTK